MTKIDNQWLMKSVRLQAQTIGFGIAGCGLLIMATLLVPAVRNNPLLFTIAAYAIIGLTIFLGLLHVIARFSKRFHGFVFRKNYQGEQKRLENISLEKKNLEESFKRFVERMIAAAVDRRPGESASLKEDSIRNMEQLRDEIDGVRGRLKKHLENDHPESVDIMKSLGELDEIDDQNLENLLEELSLIDREDGSWEQGGKESYRKRIMPVYFKHYGPQRKAKIDPLDKLIQSIKDSLIEMEKFGKERGFWIG